LVIQSAYQQEQDKLKGTFAEIAKQLGSIGPRYYGDDYVEQLLDEKREENRQRLELLAREPYFGRLDFQENATASPSQLYIGKRGMEQADSVRPYIIDWRAPVASLFYSFTGGEDKVEYEAPDGLIEGWVHRKRNLAIRDRILERVVDSYVRGGENLGVTDEFLLYRLGENKDNRLRDIVSTIQAEQDQIIRAPREKALIIQGAAGSGKTTVALHRLAFILYRYRDEVKAENMIIFAPNLMFLDYISGVLPELGVGNIRQTTFTDWAIEMLEGTVKLTGDDSSEWFALSGHNRNVTSETPGRYKGSLFYRELIEEKLRQYEIILLPQEEFIPWDGKRLTVDTMREWYDGELSRYPFAERIERLIARMKRWLDIAASDIAFHPSGNEQLKNAKKRLQVYVKKLIVPDPLHFYKQLFGVGKSGKSTLDLSGMIPSDVYQTTAFRLARNEVAYEDLAALLWIRIAFKGIDGHRFDHVVLDEAQDASPFQIAVMQAHMKIPSFTILGDLAQGIHEYRGIHQWEELYPLFESEAIAYHSLRQSYRSTTEIIEFANQILSKTDTGLPLAIPVFRSGDLVQVKQLDVDNERISFILEFIRKERSNGMHTIALITRTSDEAKSLFADLQDKEPEAQLMEENQTNYRGGLSVLPAYLAKGLEFDAVLLPNVNSELYGSSTRDAKLLYVACTRALHSLCLLYAGDRSFWISN